MNFFLPFLLVAEEVAGGLAGKVWGSGGGGGLRDESSRTQTQVAILMLLYTHVAVLMQLVTALMPLCMLVMSLNTKKMHKR